jgi:hypothetical protein
MSGTQSVVGVGEFGTRLIEALELQDQKVCSISLNLSNDIWNANVTLEMYEQQADNMIKVLKYYVLVERQELERLRAIEAQQAVRDTP